MDIMIELEVTSFRNEQNNFNQVIAMYKELSPLFEEIQTVRDNYFDTEIFNSSIHTRAVPDKWSVAESIYHCYLLLKLTRVTTAYYVPVARVYMRLRRPKVKRYIDEMPNIYRGKTMKAPFILKPKMKRDYTLIELRELLEEETEKMKHSVDHLTQKECYWIRYPDPVPKYPNVVQVVKLLRIHEEHHYMVVMEREGRNRG
ncbi:DinB family protein [Oceanobacillus jeddahense]|uniref:DinB family protein n=1 Tax=Oceanobacillus jeddahense TaxID=1462527 RepID=A0ABY5JRT6_9BACI|nr:DinB family protein [Oceanobacillus jeddahense]UUI02939.1 DinB family protein [Oceanobacillus jeddahense]